MWDILHYRSLVKNLVWKDLKLKYRGSLLGFCWSLLNPLLMLTVYTIAFKYILKIGRGDYAFFLLAGLLPWNFFSSSLVNSTRCIMDNAHLIKKVYFPRMILPIATVLFNFIQMLLALAVFLPLIFISSSVNTSWIALGYFLLLLLLNLLFTIGLAFILSALTVFFRDLTHLTEVFLLLLFWLTPIVYSISLVPDNLRWAFRLNPLAAFIVSFQDALVWGRPPEPVLILTAIGATCLSLLIGYGVFDHYQTRFAEEI